VARLLRNSESQLSCAAEAWFAGAFPPLAAIIRYGQDLVASRCSGSSTLALCSQPGPAALPVLLAGNLVHQVGMVFGSGGTDAKMNSIPSVAIVAVNYNSPQNTVETLQSLAAMEYPRFHLVLVDNGSTDNSLSIIGGLPLAFQLVRSERNLGFARGYNLGIERALAEGADAVLVINNDVLVAPDMLTHLVSALSKDTGAVGPLICYESRPDVIWSSGFRRHPITLEMMGGHRGLHVAPGMSLAAYEVDYLLGCAVLIPSEVFRDVGFFDPRFFLYYEDLDLSLRVQERGFRLLTAPAARMWHKVAGSTGIDSPCRNYHLARSSVLFFRKHSRGWRTPVIAAWRLGSATRKLIRWSRANAPGVHAYMRGLRDGWSGRLDDGEYCSR
jgi:GT2 family glycosyltransferase